MMDQQQHPPPYYYQQPQQQQHRHNPDPEVTPEHVPLLPPHHPIPPPPPPPPPQHQHPPPRQPHNRTRSVDYQPPPIFSPPRPMAPGRHHQRTRSLEEWATMFGIPGISGGQDDVVHERRDVGKKNKHKRGASHNNSIGNGAMMGAATARPPLAPKPVPFGSPSGSIGHRQSMHKRLDSIVESVDNEDDSEPSGHQLEEPETYDGGRAAFSAAALGRMSDASSSSHLLVEPTRLSEGSQGSTSRRVVDLLPNEPYQFPPSPRVFHSNSNNNPPEDSHSLDSSTLFSYPQHTLTSSGELMVSSASGGRHSSISVRSFEDDSSVDDNSTTLDFSKSPMSTHSHTTVASDHPPTTERLAKFEREQEIMFQQKKYHMERELSSVLERNSVTSHREKQEFINTYIAELEKERAKLVLQWKAEWQKEEESMRQRDPKRQLLKKLNEQAGKCLDAMTNFFRSAEVFISNMPLTIAALALSWVSMGCVWFKFMEENLDSCSHVNFYSPHCTFPEFPGCFECDTTHPIYLLGVNWHYFCSLVSFTFCSMIMLKAIIAWDVVLDELKNPTTSTPCGVFGIAMVCVFAGRGPIGEMVVLITATLHCLLAFFFLYNAVYNYRLYPDPGWFPNTVGISYAAVKTFLYFPIYGEIIMVLCLTFFLLVFFISALRVATNPKIAAPLCWFMISAPSITLYAVTLIPQPIDSAEIAFEHNPQLREHFTNFLHTYFVPLHHFMFGCSLLGVVSAIHGVALRWEKFKEKPFSPAHVAFVAPTLSHTNAIQAYRGTVMALSNFPAGGKYLTFIYVYWCFCLFVGTTVNFIFTYKFLRRLPGWTRVDTTGELAPPAPKETMTHEMLDDRGAHETMFTQPFVSPAVLEANEAGALVRVKRGTEDYRLYGPFVRTRKVTARGFDPAMNDTELREERAALLDWVAKNAPRKRNRTMSIPGVLHLRDKSGRDVYGTFLGEEAVANTDYISSDSMSSRRSSRHARSKTSVDSFW